MANPTATSPLPPQTVAQIIDLFVCGSHAGFAAIADQVELPIESVVDVLQSERVQRLIPVLRELARQRAEFTALDLRTPALYSTFLVAQSRESSNELKLRAATALLRGVPLRSVAPPSPPHPGAARPSPTREPRVQSPKTSQGSAPACASTPSTPRDTGGSSAREVVPERTRSSAPSSSEPRASTGAPSDKAADTHSPPAGAVAPARAESPKPPITQPQAPTRAPVHPTASRPGELLIPRPPITRALLANDASARDSPGRVAAIQP